MENVITLLLNAGVSIVVVAYFLWKDMTLTKENTDILSCVKTLLEQITQDNKKYIIRKKETDEND